MKKAWVITNGFLKGKKFQDILDLYVRGAGEEGFQVEVHENQEFLVSRERKLETPPDGILFLDKDILLCRWLEEQNIPVFNSSRSIASCDNKALTYLTLSKCNIPVPKTILAPFTYENVGYPSLTFLDEVVDTLHLPLVLKECFGSFGMQVYLIHSREELREMVTGLGGKPLLFQEFFPYDTPMDLRLQVVGNQVVAAMRRFAKPGEFRANVTLGGRAEAYSPTEEEKELALASTKELGLTFGGVDLLYDAQEKPVVCEVNSNAHIRNLFECTGIPVEKYIWQEIRGQLC